MNNNNKKNNIPAYRTPEQLPQEKQPRSISLEDLLNKPIKPREHLIMPWLRQGESAMIYAPPGVGKSLFALSMAIAVAGGGKLLDCWQAPKARRVMYIDGEMPLDDIRERAAMLLPASGGDAATARNNIHISARQFQHSGVTFTDLTNEASRETLIEQAKKGRVDLVILDNLSTLATIEDENAASAFNAPISFLLRLKQEGLACLLVHHSSKGGESYRGSSKIATTFEAIIKLEKSTRPTDNNNSTTSFKLSWEKLRGKRDKTTSSALDVFLEPCPFDDERSKLNLGRQRVHKTKAAYICAGGVNPQKTNALSVCLRCSGRANAPARKNWPRPWIALSPP